jgi:hypothetical protein
MKPELVAATWNFNSLLAKVCSAVEICVLLDYLVKSAAMYQRHLILNKFNRLVKDV